MASKSPTEQVRELRETVIINGVRKDNTEKRVDRYDSMEIEARFRVLETQLADLRRAGEEAEKWYRTRLGIALGAGLALLGGVVTQVIAAVVRK